MMASRVNFEVDLAQIAIEAARRLGYNGLKKKQLEAVVSFLQGNDTFVALPTGYGKSLIYAVLPYSFDRIKGSYAYVAIFRMARRCHEFLDGQVDLILETRTS